MPLDPAAYGRVTWTTYTPTILTPIDGTTVADVHAYAVATYQPTPRPGVNPAAVTDTQIAAAVAAVRG